MLKNVRFHRTNFFFFGCKIIFLRRENLFVLFIGKFPKLVNPVLFVLFLFFFCDLALACSKRRKI